MTALVIISLTLSVLALAGVVTVAVLFLGARNRMLQGGSLSHVRDLQELYRENPSPDLKAKIVKAKAAFKLARLEEKPDA